MSHDPDDEYKDIYIVQGGLNVTNPTTIQSTSHLIWQAAEPDNLEVGPTILRFSFL